MNKLTLVSMAMLCTLLMACSEQVLLEEKPDNLLLESRSTSDNIITTYENESGSEENYNCDYLTVDYENSFHADIQMDFQNASTITTSGDDFFFKAKEGYVLKITIDATTVIESSEFAIEVCGTQLCYTSENGIFSGTATDFIVDDDPSGF